MAQGSVVSLGQLLIMKNRALSPMTIGVIDLALCEFYSSMRNARIPD